MGRVNNESVYGYIRREVILEQNAALAFFLGGLIGVLATVTIGGVKIALSTSVGTLLAGLFVGHLRTRYPLFGRIPDGAVALMTSLGLAAFVGLTGIHAGPIFISALKEVGIGLLLGGMVVTLLPQAVGLAVGFVVGGAAIGARVYVRAPPSRLRRIRVPPPTS